MKTLKRVMGIVSEAWSLTASTLTSKNAHMNTNILMGDRITLRPVIDG